MEELDFLLSLIEKYAKAGLKSLDKILEIQEGTNRDRLMREWFEEALKQINRLIRAERVAHYRQLGHEGEVLMLPNSKGEYARCRIPKNKIEEANREIQRELEKGVKLLLWPQDSDEYKYVLDRQSNRLGRSRQSSTSSGDSDDVPPLVSIAMTRSRRYVQPRNFPVCMDLEVD